jgi:hypothetical protein
MMVRGAEGMQWRCDGCGGDGVCLEEALCKSQSIDLQLQPGGAASHLAPDTNHGKQWYSSKKTKALCKRGKMSLQRSTDVKESVL